MKILLSNSFYEHLKNAEYKNGLDVEWTLDDNDPDLVWCREYLSNRYFYQRYFAFANMVMENLTLRTKPTLKQILSKFAGKKTDKPFVKKLKTDEHFKEYVSLVKKHQNHYVLSSSLGIDDTTIFSSKAKALKYIRTNNLQGYIPYPYTKLLCKKYLRGRRDIDGNCN